MLSIWDFALVGSIGGLLGLCELLTRYRDEPRQAVINTAGALYTLTNALAAVVALFMLNVFDVDFGLKGPENAEKLRVTLLLVGGLGSMAFFRSSLFTLKLGEKDVPLGPGLILQILLDVTDRAVDRGRAEPRALAITEIMNDFDFEKGKLALPAYCFTLMQNVSSEEQNAVGEQVKKLESATMSSRIKAYLLGLLLLNVVGEDVLRAAIKSLGDEIKQV